MATLTARKILIVDDKPDVLTSLSQLLGNAEYAVITANSGTQALRLIKLNKPDLIILDEIMPDMLGSDVAAVLSEDASFANTPIIFLTGILTAKEEGSSPRKTGNRYVLAKPARAKQMLALIKKVLH